MGHSPGRLSRVITGFAKTRECAVRTAILLAGWVCLTAAALPAGQIEAVKGKQYRLTKEHGPWMIMVASFRDVAEPDRKTKGLSAQEAAEELVYELRVKGIPAYAFSQDAQMGEVKTKDRLGREDIGTFAAQRGMICVIAGNYPAQDDKIAERTLKYVKKFTPEYIKDESSGAIYRQTKTKGLFGAAFMTINPLLDPAEVAQQKPDYDVIKLNYGIQNALVDNKAKYSVQVATFAGRSVTPTGNSSFAGGRERDFDARLQSSRDEATGMPRVNLGQMSEDAAQLAQALRLKGFDAWVYHDRFESIVTVGSFDNPQDPRIAEIAQNFGAKTKKDPTTGQDVVVGEMLMPDARQVAQRGKASAMMWVFDPQPKVIEVPHLKAKKSKK